MEAEELTANDPRKPPANRRNKKSKKGGKPAFPGLFLSCRVGDTGLEPVTPSLSSVFGRPAEKPISWDASSCYDKLAILASGCIDIRVFAKEFAYLGAYARRVHEYSYRRGTREAVGRTDRVMPRHILQNQIATIPNR